MRPEDFESRDSDLRSILRFFGPLIVIVGLIFTIVGMVSFFSAFGGNEPPRLFWCGFVGLPLLGIGMSISKFAYLGAVTRYVAGEVAPVGKDVVNYIADGTKDSIRNVAVAATAGVREGLHGSEFGSAQSEGSSEPQVKIRCQRCRALNDESAKFCNQCGAAL